MKKELNENELGEVTGGNVTLSASLGMAYFSSVGKSCKLNPNVPFNEIRNCLLDLYDANCELSDAEFDQLVRREFRARGYV